MVDVYRGFLDKQDELIKTRLNPDFMKLLISLSTKMYPGVKEDVKALFEKIDPIERERSN